MVQRSSALDLVFPSRLLKIVVGVRAPGPSHALKLWLGVSKGMLPVEYFCTLCVSRISWRP